ncbi:MAG: DNA-protecting protein DprA [Planctomycetota bacterium]|nr:MAG: DNA-protecting protein DprA [Planctomycetota bacterium]
MATQQHSPQIELWLKLIRADGIGPTLFKRLLDYFGGVERIFTASVFELTKIEGIGNKTAESIARTRDAFDADGEISLADKLGVWMIHLQDERYPPALRAIYDPPPVLYIRGTLTRADNLAMAIVGCRRCSHYGTEQANRFSHLLASAGFTIVSGLARGIDTAAHCGALAAKGRTIAVQGCGLSNIFPPENEKLFAQIAENGAVISELPLAYEPLSENFPARNRIIAGLSMGVLVVEATYRSGALISAQAAMDNNREVMAVPGRIDSPCSAGCHKLLKQGARLIDGIDEIMDALGYVGDGLKTHADAAATEAEQNAQGTLFDLSRLNLTKEEEAILGQLNSEPVHVEELIELTRLSAAKVHSATISLQLKGLVKQLPGNMLVKRRSG